MPCVQAREHRPLEPQARRAADPRDERRAGRQARDGTRFEPDDRDRERSGREVEAILDRRDARRPGGVRRARDEEDDDRRGEGAFASARGHVRLGSFFSALVYLSAEAAAELEAAHPELFRHGHGVIRDELVDSGTAMRRLAAGELDLALVFEHEFEPDPATWRATRGSAPTRARPVEAQAFIAAGVTVAHEPNVLVDPRRIAGAALAGVRPSATSRRRSCAISGRASREGSR